jgi:hypothetical protein
MRGGFGLFSVGTNSAGANGFMITSPIFADSDVSRYTSTDHQITWKTTLDKIPYVRADPTGRNAASVQVFPDHNPMSQFEQYNFNIESEFKSILFEIGYAGTRGVHLQYGAYNLNAIPVALAPVAQGRFIAPYVPYPQYPSGVTSNSWIGSSNYNSLQIKAERRFSSGLGFIAAYTFAKLIDVGQLGYRDPLVNRNLDRGLAPDNAPNRFTIAYNYRLPFGKGAKWVTSGPLVYVIGGRELSGITTFQSGASLTPGLSTNSCVLRRQLRGPQCLKEPAPGCVGAELRALVRYKRVQRAIAVHNRERGARTDLRTAHVQYGPGRYEALPAAVPRGNGRGVSSGILQRVQ